MPHSSFAPRTRKLLAGVALAAVAALLSPFAAAAPPSAATKVSSTPLRAYVTPTPQGDILRYVQKLADEEGSGLKLTVIESSKGIDANQLVLKGDVDVSLFQHQPFFASWIAAHPEAQDKVVNVATLLVNVFGLYSSKYPNAQALPEGAKILVPNEQTNLPRALFILQNEGLLKLSYAQSDGSAAALNIDEKNILENPKNLQFIATETRLRAQSLPDVDASFINGDIALTHDIDPQSALSLEDKANNPYANVLTTRKDLVADPRVALLIDYLTGEKVAQYITDNYRGFVVPAQARLQP